MNTLPMKTKGQPKIISIRVDDDLKSKQEELSNANINVSQVLRDAILDAWCQFKGVDKVWKDGE